MSSKSISLTKSLLSTKYYIMFYLTGLLAAYAVGISDSDTNLSTVENFEKIANCSVGY